MDPQQQLLDERHTALMAAIVSVHERLDLLNGRTRESEQRIAVLDDRSGRSNAVSISALSAVVVAAIYWVIEAVKR
jgi:hypothetical protein